MEIDDDELEAFFEDASKDVAREGANRWFSKSQEILLEEGDSREWDVFPVVQSGVPPFWDSDAEGFRFGYTHIAAPFFEYGTAPHEIRATNADYLAFPGENGETVFRKSVQHPGTPALRYMEKSKQRMMREMENSGGSDE